MTGFLILTIFLVLSGLVSVALAGVALAAVLRVMRHNASAPPAPKPVVMSTDAGSASASAS